MGAKRQVVARKLVEFAPLLGGRHLIRVTVGPSLAPVLLSLESKPDYRARAGNCSARGERASHPNRYRVHYLADGDWAGIDLPPTGEEYYAADERVFADFFEGMCR